MINPFILLIILFIFVVAILMPVLDEYLLFTFTDLGKHILINFKI